MHFGTPIFLTNQCLALDSRQKHEGMASSPEFSETHPTL